MYDQFSRHGVQGGPIYYKAVPRNLALASSKVLGWYDRYRYRTDSMLNTAVAAIAVHSNRKSRAWIARRSCKIYYY